MSTSVANVLTEMCSAPLDAAVKAEREYRAIWKEWLAEKIAWYNSLSDAEKKQVNLSELLKVAPAIEANSRVDMAVTMRIASTKETSAGGKAGLAVGPFHVSGNFGTVSRSSEESVLQASTSVTLSNMGQDLSSYLSQHNIKPTDAAGLDQAIQFLSS